MTQLVPLSSPACCGGGGADLECERALVPRPAVQPGQQRGEVRWPRRERAHVGAAARRVLELCAPGSARPPVAAAVRQAGKRRAALAGGRAASWGGLMKCSSLLRLREQYQPRSSRLPASLPSQLARGGVANTPAVPSTRSYTAPGSRRLACPVSRHGRPAAPPAPGRFDQASGPGRGAARRGGGRARGEVGLG